MTELGLHPICRSTSLRDSPTSSKAKARLRRSSKRPTLPYSLGISIMYLQIYYGFIYAAINSKSSSTAEDLSSGTFTGQRLTMCSKLRQQRLHVGSVDFCSLPRRVRL